MKVSLNWANKYSNIDLKPLDTAELVKLATERLGGVEGYADLKNQYNGIVVAKIISCEKHPNADKLNICKIDDGGVVKDVDRDENGNVQIVCGAPNAKQGLVVAWLPPGVIVPSTFSDVEPLQLDKREIRGVLSNGMLASAEELDLGDDHSGIVELDTNIKPGEDFASIFELDDVIIDIENKMFTHRPDCFGVLGVARELAVIQGYKFDSPSWYKKTSDLVNSSVNYSDNLKVKIDAPDLCPRYMAISIDNVKIEPSPLWLQSYLRRMGIRPRNNVVDITNYIMLLTAQPLHAFDLDKISENNQTNIVIRRPQESEEMKLLDGKLIKPHKDAVLICNENGPIALGGVMGASNSEIDESTTRIVLECATFNMYNIRKTSMIHGIFTDAVTRFNKGQPATQLPYVMGLAVEMLEDIVKANVVGEIVDVSATNTDEKDEKIIRTDIRFISNRLGKEFSPEEIVAILNNAEFRVDSTNDRLEISVPFWRTDIEIAEDIVEEVGRVYGFNNLPLSLPMRSIQPVAPTRQAKMKTSIRRFLADSGANELTTHSFISEAIISKTKQDVNQAHKIRNALSPDLNYYRMTLLPSLLDKVHFNHKSGFDKFAIFELGRVHNKTDLDPSENLPSARNVLALVFSSNQKKSAEIKGAPYFQAKNYLDLLADNFGLKPKYHKLSDAEVSGVWPESLSKVFLKQRSAAVTLGDKFLGVVGEFNPAVSSSFKLESDSAGFEIDLSALNEPVGSVADYQPLSKYQPIYQDVTYEFDSSVIYADANSVLTELLSSSELSVSAKLVDAYQKAEKKRLTWHLVISSVTENLTNSDANNLLKLLDKAMLEQFSATRI